MVLSFIAKASLQFETRRRPLSAWLFNSVMKWCCVCCVNHGPGTLMFNFGGSET